MLPCELLAFEESAGDSEQPWYCPALWNQVSSVTNALIGLSVSPKRFLAETTLGLGGGVCG